jgi:hypothetical protein
MSALPPGRSCPLGSWSLDLLAWISATSNEGGWGLDWIGRRPARAGDRQPRAIVTCDYSAGSEPRLPFWHPRIPASKLPLRSLSSVSRGNAGAPQFAGNEFCPSNRACAGANTSPSPVQAPALPFTPCTAPPVIRPIAALARGPFAAVRGRPFHPGKSRFRPATL